MRSCAKRYLFAHFGLAAVSGTCVAVAQIPAGSTFGAGLDILSSRDGSRWTPAVVIQVGHHSLAKIGKLDVGVDLLALQRRNSGYSSCLGISTNTCLISGVSRLLGGHFRAIRTLTDPRAGTSLQVFGGIGLSYGNLSQVRRIGCPAVGGACQAFISRTSVEHVDPALSVGLTAGHHIGRGLVFAELRFTRFANNRVYRGILPLTLGYRF